MARTVRALVREPLQSKVVEGDYLLCLNPACAQVYTASGGARPFTKADLKVRVGFKEADLPHLVCYCFEHTVEEIEAELKRSGYTTIPERIRTEVKAGRCACDVKNPQGTCCLGNVARAVKEAEDRVAGRGSPPVGAPSSQCAPTPLALESHADCCGLPGPMGTGPVGAVHRLNRVLLPILTPLILATVLFPHRVLGWILPAQKTAEPATLAENVSPGNAEFRTAMIYVEGMT